MAIQFTCTACGQPIEVDDEMADQAVTCLYCQKVVTTPAMSTLEGGAAAQAAATVEPGEVAIPVYAPDAPPPKTGLLGWIALACIVVSVLCLMYVGLVARSMMEGMDLKPETPQEIEEFQKAVQERMQSRPSLLVLSPLGSCVFPLAGVVCAIIALVKGYRPRWPAIVALCLVGGIVVLGCAGFLIGSAASSPFAGG